MGVATEVREISALRKRDAAILDGQFSRKARVAYQVTRPRTVAIVVAVGLLMIAAVVLVAYLNAPPAPDETREVDIATIGEDGNEVATTGQVANEGIFVSDDGSEVTVTVDAPLPGGVTAEIDDFLASVDLTSPDAVAEINDYLGTRVSGTGKSFAYLMPAVLSCDGVEYFDGYAIRGEAVQDLISEEDCSQQRTLEGARALLAALVASSAEPGVIEVFEVGLDKADTVHGSSASDQPVTEQTVAPEPPRQMTDDELQVHGGTY